MMINLLKVKKMDTQLIKNEFSNFNKFYKKKNIKQAVLSLEKILKINSKQTEAIFFLGTIYLQSKNFDKAKKFFLNFIKIDSKNQSVY